MKPGVRALGIAESYRTERSTVCGAVTTTAGVSDGFVFAECTVGGLDATEAVTTCWNRLDREDIRYVFVGGVAPAWYNILDIDRLVEEIDVPTLLITFEESAGLEPALTEHFEGQALDARLARYEALPDRVPVELPDGRLFVRTLDDLDCDPGAVVRPFVRSGERPEPIRVARLAARAADRWRRSGSESEPI